MIVLPLRRILLFFAEWPIWVENQSSRNLAGEVSSSEKRKLRKKNWAAPFNLIRSRKSRSCMLSSHFKFRIYLINRKKDIFFLKKAEFLAQVFPPTNKKALEPIEWYFFCLELVRLKREMIISLPGMKLNITKRNSKSFSGWENLFWRQDVDLAWNTGATDF